MATTLAIIMTLCTLAGNAGKVDNSTVESLNLGKYLGLWYEIARFDHSFERGLQNVTAVYSIRTDGKIKVVNSGWKDGEYKVSTGKSKVTGTPALLKVSFFGPFYSDYRVLMITPDYQQALVGSSSSKYLWILSRNPVLTDEVKRSILDEAQRRGYDTEKLIWVGQSASKR